MSLAAREVLLQPFRGDRPGVTFYSLHRKGDWKGGDFPLGLFEGAVRNGEFRMHGELWEVLLWDVTFADDFPPNGPWRVAVEGVFSWIFASGGVVAWVGDGIGYVSPPHLFDSAEMSNCVFEGRSKGGRVLGHLDLDQPVRYLEALQLTALRELSDGLAESA